MCSTQRCSTSSKKIEKAFFGRSEGSESWKRKILNTFSPVGFYILNCSSESLFIQSSPCGISQRHGGSPAADWQLTPVTGRSPRGCRWPGRGTGWCAVWYVPSALGYCRDTQIILLSHSNLSFCENSYINIWPASANRAFLVILGVIVALQYHGASVTQIFFLHVNITFQVRGKDVLY